jgi:hypothetical protein
LEVLLASVAEVDLQTAKMPVQRQVGPGFGIAEPPKHGDFG